MLQISSDFLDSLFQSADAVQSVPLLFNKSIHVFYNYICESFQD